MSITLKSVEVINNLKQSIETVTDETYTNLTEAVQTLGNKYNQGGIIKGITDFTDFWKNGKCFEAYNNIDTSEGIIFNNALAGNTELTELPQYLKVTDKAISLSYMFYNCKQLETLPEVFDISNCEDLSAAFFGTKIKNFPPLNTSKVKNFNSAFSQNRLGSGRTFSSDIDMSSAETAEAMFATGYIYTFPPLKNTQNVKSFKQAFWKGCYFTEAELDIASCTDMRSAFNECSKLTTLTLRNTDKVTSTYWDQCFSSCAALVNFNVDYLNIVNNKLSFANCTKLSVESLLNILNALSDNSALTTTYSVTLGETNLNKLTAEQKAIATNKNIALI